jgi:hypothetical protein
MPRNRERWLGTVNAIYAVFDRASGVPLAVIDGDALTVRRTAAASLLAARYLARPDARNVLIVGTGRLAPHMARAHCARREISRLRIWGRNGEGAQTLAQMLRDEGLPAQAVDDLEAAVRDSHIVSCATTATMPIIKGAWLAPGTHLDLVGGFRRSMREADDASVARSRVYVDTYAGALAEALTSSIRWSVVSSPASRCEVNSQNSSPAAWRGAVRPTRSRCSSRWARRSRISPRRNCFCRALIRQHLARVLPRGFRDLLAAEHAGQFLDAGLAVEQLEV